MTLIGTAAISTAAISTAAIGTAAIGTALISKLVQQSDQPFQHCHTSDTIPFFTHSTVNPPRPGALLAIIYFTTSYFICSFIQQKKINCIDQRLRENVYEKFFAEVQFS